MATEYADLGDGVTELINWDDFDIPTIPDMGKVAADMDFTAHALIALAQAGIEFTEVST